MTDVNDNMAEAVTDTVEPSQDDTPNDFDYYDPDEDNVEIEETNGNDDETVEAEADDEAESQETEETVETEDEAKPEFNVTLPDGTTVSADEAARGYMMQADYSRKTAQLSETRSAVQADAQQLESVVQNLADFLTKNIPPEPDVQLAMTNPAEYTAQLAQHTAQIKQIQALVDIGQSPKEITTRMSGEERREAQVAAEVKLVAAVPELAGPEGRKKFDTALKSVSEAVGFSPAELSGVTDHRMYQLAYLAAKGLEAQKTVKTAKEKVAKAPAPAPRKPSQGATRTNNAQAMRKLSKSGSLKDALAVDFD